MNQPSSELKNTTYEIFIGALSILSMTNIALYLLIREPIVQQTIVIMDDILSIIFLIDFTYRLFTAGSKSQYFVRQAGWADLLGSLPFPGIQILRLFRVFRAGRLLRKYGTKGIISTFLANRAQSTLLTLTLLIILLLEFGSIAMLRAELHAPGANITTAGDSLWYSYVTITTVGYGDRYPVSAAGRIIGVIIMTAGVGLFGTFTGFLANAFLTPQKPPAAEEPPGAPDDPKAKLAELRQLLADQHEAMQSQHEAMQRKIAELERQLG
jgi:voltage-gated potassium channel